jgi:hypothetical protein
MTLIPCAQQAALNTAEPHLGTNRVIVSTSGLYPDGLRLQQAPLSSSCKGPRAISNNMTQSCLARATKEVAQRQPRLRRRSFSIPLLPKPDICCISLCMFLFTYVGPFKLILHRGHEKCWLCYVEQTILKVKREVKS